MMMRPYYNPKIMALIFAMETQRSPFYEREDSQKTSANRIFELRSTCLVTKTLTKLIAAVAASFMLSSCRLLHANPIPII